jgi:hypothetical protein
VSLLPATLLYFNGSNKNSLLTKIHENPTKIFEQSPYTREKKVNATNAVILPPP